MRRKIVLTGGHAGSTAYAVIQAIKESDLDWEISFIGTKTAIEGKDVETFEASVFPQIGVNFYPITSGRIQRKFTKWTIPSLLKIPAGFFQAIEILSDLKPDAVLSFGGFTSYPVVVVAWLMRIPVLIHEQTAAAGRANKYSTYFAKKVLLARGSSKKYFPEKKSVVIGNPISKEILNIKPKVSTSEPTLLVTGGSRGSQVINENIEKILPDLLENYNVIHQAGLDDQKKFEKLKKTLPENIRNKYEVFGFSKPWDWWKMIEKADVVVSRAGANSVSEFIAAKRPSLFIPIPFTYMDEQTLNAKIAEKHHLAIILKQDDLTDKTLLKVISELMKEKDIMVKKSLQDGYNPDRTSAKELVEILSSVIS